jgi:hypothetical protein
MFISTCSCSMGRISSTPNRRCFGTWRPQGEGELQALVERLAERIGGVLERRGILARDAENSYLELELEPAAGGPMADLLGHSVTHRVALGPRAGQKVLSELGAAAGIRGSRSSSARVAAGGSK